MWFPKVQICFGAVQILSDESKEDSQGTGNYFQAVCLFSIEFISTKFKSSSPIPYQCKKGEGSTEGKLHFFSILPDTEIITRNHHQESKHFLK